MLGLGAHFLAGDDLDKRVDVVLGPFALEGFGGSLRDADGVGQGAELLETFPHQREGGHPVHDVCHRLVDRLGPGLHRCQRLVAPLHLCRQGGVAQFALSRDPLLQRPGIRHLDLASLHLRAFPEQAQRAHQRRETVRPPALRVEVHEVPAFPGVFADRLQVEMFDEHRGEALLVFDLHAVEDAAVGVDADEEFLRWLELAQYVCWIAHRIFEAKSRRPNARESQTRFGPEN